MLNSEEMVESNGSCSEACLYEKKSDVHFLLCLNFAVVL